MENYNQYVAKLVHKQIDANMQKELRDYGKKEEKPKEKEELLDGLSPYVKLNLYTFFYNILRTLCNREIINDYQIEEQELAKALRHINEQCLDDKNFSKVFTGELNEFSKDIEKYTIKDDNGHFVYVKISYLPSLGKDVPNILRFNITKYISIGNKNQCYIDFNSNGNVDVQKIDNQEFYFNQDVLEEIEDYLMNIYELADLKTNNMHK